MAEREFFVEKTDVTDQCKDELKSTRAQYTFAFVFCGAVALASVGLVSWAQLLATVGVATVTARFVVTLESRRKLVQAVNGAPVYERFRIEGDEIVHTRGSGDVQLVEEKINLSEMFMFHVSFNGVDVSSNLGNQFKSIDIPREAFIDDHARHDFVKMLIPRVKADPQDKDLLDFPDKDDRHKPA